MRFWFWKSVNFSILGISLNSWWCFPREVTVEQFVICQKKKGRSALPWITNNHVMTFHREGGGYFLVTLVVLDFIQSYWQLTGNTSTSFWNLTHINKQVSVHHMSNIKLGSAFHIKMDQRMIIQFNLVLQLEKVISVLTSYLIIHRKETK